MAHSFTTIFRLKNLLPAGFLVLSALSFHNSHAQEPDRRFRLGPSLEEYELQEKETEQPSTPISAEPVEEPTFEFDQDEWNRMRRIEEGTEEEPSVKPVETSTATAEPPKPPPGLLNVDLPYESSLSVTGRKVIDVEIKNTHISAERAEELGTKQDSQTFNMRQELQARIQGTVARKTTINVNFDDTKDNVKDFSVVYKGDPDEVVQEAAFGDIVLSLPSTEFVNYNKQLFGIRASLKYKKFGFMAIGSRTKGTTETQRFTGATKRQQAFVNDVGYIRRRFYDLTFSTANAAGEMSGAGGPLAGHTILPINGNIPEEVFIEDTTGLNPQATIFAVATPTAPATTVTLRMRQMSPGVDYSMDRLKGIITFTNPLPEDVRVAIDFTLQDGTRLSSLVAGGNGVIIKDRTPEESHVSQEIKRFYFAGSRNIVRDNGLGNFTLRVLDKNRETDIGDTLSPVQRYPDTIEMNFETGIFELDALLPFSDVYASNANAGTPLQAVFSLEFQSVVRTFTLKPNIVLQSESVLVNGRKVTRDLDYFIDYDIGIITFFNEDLIRESTVIEITYEFAPFGGVLGETLVGARGTYDILQNKQLGPVRMEGWQAGSTVLYNFAAKPSGPPDIRSTPASLLVTEGDTQVKGFKVGKLPITTNFTAEAARSVEDPNLFGKALIDSMEGVKQEDASPLIEDSWQMASNPNGVASDFRGWEEATSHLRWSDIDVTTTDPNDDAGTTQKALEIGFTLNSGAAAPAEEVSLINVISLSGRDFSKKTTLEVELEGAGAANTDVVMEVQYGSFNEDADADGLLDTEDEIPFDGILNLGEDEGFTFNSPGPDLDPLTAGDNAAILFGPGNARLDAEDLNNDRVLSAQDLGAFPTPIFSQSVGFTGRQLFQIPLNITSLGTEFQGRLTTVKQVRVTLRNTSPGTAKNGSVRIVRLAMVGNTYEPATVAGSALSTMTVRAVNSKDDAPRYITLVGHPDYNDLYQGATPDITAKEQALSLDYFLTDNSSATTRNIFGAPRDFSSHDIFKFFLSKPSGCTIGCGGQFIFQVGSETEYQQATVNIASIPVNPLWMVVKIAQSDANNDGTPDTWISLTDGVTINQVGVVPNLSQVSQIKMGIVNNNTGGDIEHEVWVNEIHVAQPHERRGHARRYTFDSTWAQWMDFGGTYRDVDRNWQTPTTAVTNQDSTQSNAYLNFNRLSFMPMSFRTTRDVNVTPSAFRANENALVSFLEEGRVERVTNSGNAKLIVPKLPVFDFNYTNDTTENTITQRKEIADTVGVGATYAPTLNIDILPTRLTFRPIPNSITFLTSHKRTKLRFPTVEELNRFEISTAPFNSTDLTQFSDEHEARLAFKPWNGFTFNPTYKLRKDTEKRDFREDELQSLGALSELNGRETPRLLSQSISAAGNIQLLKWLNPRYSYSITGTETNGLPTQSNTTAYQLKTITRNSDGELSTAIQVNQIFPKVKLINSMNLNTSYKVEAGDTYNDMPESFKWRGRLWVGDELAVATGAVARRVEATDRRTIRANLAWQPLSAYTITRPRLKPLGTLSITNNFLQSIEETETTGTTRRVDSKTLPDLIVTVNDVEDIFGVKRVVDASRLVIRSNRRTTVTRAISDSKQDALGGDYQFQFLKKFDVSTTLNTSHARDINLITGQLTSKTETLGYSLQTRIPVRVWAFTPRYEHNQVDSRDSVQVTNDLKNDIYSLQVYGDISKPLGLRLGRREIGLANRAILNGNVKWDKKRSSVNPAANYLDTYSVSLDTDYTLSQNFRLKVGGTFSQEVHHPDFKKLDQTTFGLNSTLTIQF